MWLVTLVSRRPDTASAARTAARGARCCLREGRRDPQTPQGKVTGRALSPIRLLGTVSSFPPISKSYGLRRVAAQPPPCARSLFSGLAKNAGKLGGGDTGNASFPLRTAPAASGGSWGRGAGWRKVVPPPRQTRTPQPCTQKGSFSPILAHCECPLSGESRPVHQRSGSQAGSSGRGEVFFLEPLKEGSFRRQAEWRPAPPPPAI